jgi:hypothetical protein
MMMNVEQSVEWELAAETEVLGETCPSATLSTTNATWRDLGSNPGRHGGKPTTNRLSYGTAIGTTGDTGLSLIYTLYSSPLHTQ